MTKETCINFLKKVYKNVKELLLWRQEMMAKHSITKFLGAPTGDVACKHKFTAVPWDTRYFGSIKHWTIISQLGINTISSTFCSVTIWTEFTLYCLAIGPSNSALYMLSGSCSPGFRNRKVVANTCYLRSSNWTRNWGFLHAKQEFYYWAIASHTISTFWYQNMLGKPA